MKNSSSHLVNYIYSKIHENYQYYIFNYVIMNFISENERSQNYDENNNNIEEWNNMDDIEYGRWTNQFDDADESKKKPIKYWARL